MINNQPAAAENGQDGEILLSIDVGEQHQGAQVGRRDPLWVNIGSNMMEVLKETLKPGEASFASCQIRWVESLSLDTWPYAITNT